MSSALSRLRLPLFVFALGFLILFLLRLGYGYLQADGKSLVLNNQLHLGSVWEFASEVKNYASFKRKGFVAAGGAPAASGDQKYEKVANVGLNSAKFEDDEGAIRDLIAANDALIQFEQRKGLEGRRTLRLAVGVDPAAFDAFVEKVQAFGRLTHLSIDKSDKTNEYRDLQAKRRALEKTREALAALKSRDGEIRALVELEQQILSLEQQIQGLGVSLGDFDTENEFVTVKLFLAEAKAAPSPLASTLILAFDAFAWTLFYYPLIWIGVAACFVSALIGAHLVRLAASTFAAADAQIGKA